MSGYQVGRIPDVLKRAHAGQLVDSLSWSLSEAQLVVFKLTAKREEFRVTDMPAAHIAQPNRNFGKFPVGNRATDFKA